MTKMANLNSLINIVTYNCQSLPKSYKALRLRPDLFSLFETNDIICLQETWLTTQELGILNSLHKDFNGCGVSAMDNTDGIRIGRPYGGVCIMWRKSLDKYILPTYYDCNWLVGIKCTFNNNTLSILNTYMPYECHSNVNDYIENLGFLSSTIESGIDSTCFAILGDWNANTKPQCNSRFAALFNNFVEENGLISSVDHLPRDSFTYVSSVWDTVSWLDHAVFSQDFFNSVIKLNIDYAISQVDHMPLVSVININTLPDVDLETTDGYFTYRNSINWESMTKEDKDLFSKRLDIEFTNDLPSNIEDLVCNNFNCKSESHLHAIEETYNLIVSRINKVMEHFMKKSTHSKSLCKAGWNDYVKCLYQDSKHFFNLWKENGRPRQGVHHCMYIKYRAKFKHAMKMIKKNENGIRNQKLAYSLKDKKSNFFWKQVKSVRNKQLPQSLNIDGISGPKQITDLWYNHYKSIFNYHGKANINASKIGVSSADAANYEMMSVEQLYIAISQFKCRKAPGLDNIPVEVLKLANLPLVRLLCNLFNSCIIHGYLPDKFMYIVLVPVIKNKTKKVSSRDNYRPISLASTLSKLFEIILLDRLDPYLTTCANQFGFKKGCGTNECIYLAKEIINYYKSLNGAVFTAFLDASKAFDLVNHSTLFSILQRRNIPSYFFRIIVYWYTKQRACVKWGNNISSFFCVVNGIKQGGILSPRLFNLYVDELSIKLNKVYIGCCIGNLRINHLFYADDLFLLSPSSRGLQCLLNVCTEMGVVLDINFNPDKCAVLIFNKSIFKRVTLPDFSISNCIIKVLDNYKYLGHFFSDDITDDLDIQRQIRKTYAEGNALITNFRCCSTDVKVQLFKSLCTCFYTPQLWSSFKKSVFSKLSIAYHCVFKKLMSISKYESNSICFVNFFTPTFQEIMRKHTYSFMQRLLGSNNTFVVALQGSDLFYRSSLQKFWISQLYLNV